MANPQVKNGYIKIANEIAKAFCSNRFSGQQWQILWVIIAKTYGWNKKTDMISLRQFAENTRITRQKCCVILRQLTDMGVTQKGNTSPTTYSLQKDYTQWKVLPKKVTVTQKGNGVLPKKGTKLLPKKVTPIYTKDKKDTIQKTAVSFPFDEIWNKYPKKDGKDRAMRSFKASVKTQEDWDNITKALDNYLQTKTVLEGFIKNGSTWFNQWRDFIDYKEESDVGRNPALFRDH